MKAWSLAALAAILSPALAMAQAPDLSRMDVVERSAPDGPVAIVDGKTIDRERYLNFYRTQLAQLAIGAGLDQIEDPLRVRTALTSLAQLIEREVLLGEAERRGVTVTQAEVDREYAEELEGLRQYMAEPGQPALTEAEVLVKLNQSRDTVRENMRKMMMVEKVIDLIADEANPRVSDEEVRQFYEENRALFQQSNQFHLRQIFIEPKPNARDASPAQWDEAEQGMERALARMRAGERFEAVARETSQAPDAPRGGDMGMLPAMRLPPFFVERAQALAPGEMSEIFRSDHGVHLIRLEEAADATRITLDEAREDIRALLREHYVEDALDEFVQPILMDPDRVKIFLHLERTLAHVATD